MAFSGNNNDNDLDDRIEQLKQKHFAHHPPDFVRLNNGSFGSCPSEVLDEQERLRRLWFSNPDAFIYNSSDEGFWSRLRESLNVVAGVLNCPDPCLNHLCLVDNATTGAAIVAKVKLYEFYFFKKCKKS